MGQYPNAYSPELADEILRTIAESSVGLRVLCKRHAHWPVPTVIRDWVHEIPGFASKYAKAKMMQADNLADDILEIADEEALMYHDEHGNNRVDSGHVVKSKLKIDTRKWLAGKLSPKVYGANYITDDSEENNEEIIQTRKVIQKCMPIKKKRFPKSEE